MEHSVKHEVSRKGAFRARSCENAVGTPPFDAWALIDARDGDPEKAADDNAGTQTAADGHADARATVRTIEDPHVLFMNDPIQILRGCRLIGEFGYTIDPDTFQAMLSHKLFLMHIEQEQRPRLGIIPVGTGNDYARTLSIPLDGPEAALQSLLAGQERALDVGLCNDEYFVETLSFGLDAAIALDTSARQGAG